MYETKGNVSTLGEFGWLLEVIAGSVEGAALGTAWAVKRDALKKEQRKLKKSEKSKYSIVERAKAEELAVRERLLGTKSKTELYKDTTVKKLVILGGVTVVVITALTIGVLYKGAK
jgi:hypothetical protein